MGLSIATVPYTFMRNGLAELVFDHSVTKDVLVILGVSEPLLISNIQ